MSEKYDEITDKRDYIQLQQWAAMTCEATNHMVYWYNDQLKTDFDMVSVLSQLEESEDSEVLGITKRIKQELKTVKKEIVMATEDKIQKEIESVKVENKKDIAEAENRILSAIASLQASIDNQSSSDKKSDSNK